MRAISAAARRAAPALGVSVSDLRTYLVFDRFLGRVFARADPAFMLKGGTRMLAFIPAGRATVDIDLESGRMGLEAAVAHLAELVAVDIGDRLSFRLMRRVDGDRGDQPALAVTSLRFELDEVPGLAIKVDLAVHERIGVSVIRAAPRFRVPLGKPVPVVDYAMISVEQQIADKAAAMMERNHAGGDGRSSRAKDLVDLALIAMHLPCDGLLLREATEQQIRERRLEPFLAVDASPEIQRGFARVARGLSGFGLGWREAEELVNMMLAPALRGEAQGTWVPDDRAWRSL
ncbi:nucleotidyl transferase AbiEii/AbiGii toxin family protein [Clavibacter tessellarius]|nr:nucleotidyl transferase AbiEii/AbiGii toxin family protein [Clavibacter michiganensis]MDA3806140.1 nucleotidyl transferase AbiEii/AbiGii toxin family protein [Clavibacter sp. CT19]